MHYKTPRLNGDVYIKLSSFCLATEHIRSVVENSNLVLITRSCDVLSPCKNKVAEQTIGQDRLPVRGSQMVLT